MAGALRSFFRRIDNLLRKKPTPPTLPTRQQRLTAGGHRGIAAGSLTEGEQDFSEENVAKWHTLGIDETEDFVFNQVPLFVHSTNVLMAQYFHDEQKMMVEFRGGGKYLYSNVSENEAISLAKAQSKGAAVWDLFRVRGTKNGHKKPYVKVG